SKVGPNRRRQNLRRSPRTRRAHPHRRNRRRGALMINTPTNLDFRHTRKKGSAMLRPRMKLKLAAIVAGSAVIGAFAFAALTPSLALADAAPQASPMDPPAADAAAPATTPAADT